MNNSLSIIIIVISLLLFSCGKNNESNNTKKKQENNTSNLLAKTFIKDNYKTNTNVKNNTLSTNVLNEVSKMNFAFETFMKLESGEFPSEDELLKLIDAIDNKEQLEGIAHKGIYTMPDPSVLDKVIFICTNASLRAKNPNIVNSFLHMAGAACERRAKMSGSKSKKHYKDYAIEFYKSLIDRVEKGIATEEAANTAYYLASMYCEMRDYKTAEEYYIKFAEYSIDIDKSKSNSEFAYTKLSRMLMYNEPKRAHEITTRILKENPNTKHLKSLTLIKNFSQLRQENPDLSYQQLYNLAQEE
jgi:tetratricopeptide (TPR) repeat protein